MKNKFIAIEGNIGAGKTTLATAMAKELNARLMLEEFEHNSFLPLFYRDPERYAFPLEMSFLADRYEQYNRFFANQNLFQSLTISDYIFNKTLLFGKSNLTDQEYVLYRKFVNSLIKSIPTPDVVIYLHASPSYLLQNIVKRGREFEKKITEEYLSKLEGLYFSFMKNNQSMKFLVVDREENNLDFNLQSHWKLIHQYIENSNLDKGLNIYSIRL